MDQWTPHPIGGLNLTVSDTLFIKACPADTAHPNATVIFYFDSPFHGLTKIGWWLVNGSLWQSQELQDLPPAGPSTNLACETFAGTGDVLWLSTVQGQVQQWWRSANASNGTWTHGKFHFFSTHDVLHG
jgi:hypothetical protein